MRPAAFTEAPDRVGGEMQARTPLRRLSPASPPLCSPRADRAGLLLIDAMRVFLAGASGVIGVRLIRLLASDDHEVTGMTRSPERAEVLRELGAEPVVCDVFDLRALTEAVQGFRPELVMHQLTDLPDEVDRIAEFAPRNNRIRN